MNVAPDTQRLLTALDGMPIIGYVSSHSGHFGATRNDMAKREDFESAVPLVRQSDALREIGRLRQELRNLADAKRFDRDRFDDDTLFADWAQSRARHALGSAA